MPVRPATPRLHVLVLSVALLIGAAPAASAQGLVVHGIVVDTAGRPVADASVTIYALSRLTRTDEAGRFSFPRITQTAVELSVRRVGYEQANVAVRAERGATDTVRIVLVPAVTRLDTVTVTAAQLRHQLWMAEFEERRQRGVGAFITRREIEARNSSRPSDVVRTIPGVRLVRTPSGTGIRFPSSGSGRRDCPPMMWIDGQRVPGMEIDVLNLRDIEALELYQGPSTTPLRFSIGSSGTSCGTVVVWTRPPGAR
jgi:hypothetical protein